MKLSISKDGWLSKKARRKAEGIDPEKVKKIAVIRHAAMGDMVLTRPFLIELRKNFPNAVITLSLISNYTHGAPEDLVDRVHVHYGSDQRDRSFFEQVKKARELGPQDIIFDLAATTRSFMVCALNSAKLKIGFPYRAHEQRLYYDIAILRTDLVFEAEMLLHFLNALGMRTSLPLEFRFPVPDPVKRERPYVVYFTTASVREKSWPPENYAELIGRMADKYSDHEHIILEGKSEWESVDKVFEMAGGGENISMAKSLDLQQTISLLNGAEALISNDTGIRHLAIACNTPTVGIFLHTGHLFRYWPRGGIHEAAFSPDGSLPSVDDVFDIAAGHFQKVIDR